MYEKTGEVKQLEFKNLGFKIKALEEGMFEGYASIFNNVDAYRDIVTQGAFQRSINNNMSRIKVLWQHNIHEPIGRPIEMYEDAKGLYMKAKLTTSIDSGKKCYELMKDGVINELSIGYDTIIEEYDKINNVRYLKEVKLWEVSAVTFAANELATVNAVKNLDKIHNELAMRLKAGRTFSKSNKSKIEDIIALLMALIEEEDDDSEEIDSEISTCNPMRKNAINLNINKINDINSNDIHLILNELKKYK